MYRHSQTGILIMSLMGAVVLVTVVATALTPDAVVIGIGTLLVFVVLGSLFYRLVIEVDSHAIRLAFGVGLIRRAIPVADVADARPVRNSWLYGWGIRLTPHGWMWNVAGLDAVELTYRNGKRFRIGTDEPDRLADIIRRAAGLGGSAT